MKQYQDLLKAILDKANETTNRTGTNALALFGHQMRFDLREGFPLVTTKKVFTRGLIEELLWFLRGSTNNEELVEKNVHIWDSWAIPEDVYQEVQLTPPELVAALALKLEIEPKEAISKLMEADAQVALDREAGKEIPPVNGGYAVLQANNINPVKQVKVLSKGELGPIYGNQWRRWDIGRGQTIDQIADLIHNLKTKPYSRRHVVTAWNPAVLPDESISPQENVVQGRQSLASCHCMFQFHVEPMSLTEVIQSFTERGHANTGFEIQKMIVEDDKSVTEQIKAWSIQDNVPISKLSCQLYQR